MRFPESISREEYEKITQRSLRLFLSVDIVNSTALKQDYREKGQSWLELAHSFYTKFPSMLGFRIGSKPEILRLIAGSESVEGHRRRTCLCRAD